MQLSLDVARIRGQYTSLAGQWTYLNAHEVPQIPEPVSSAVARAFRDQAVAQPLEPNVGTHARGVAPGTLFAQEHLAAARLAIADLTGTTADAVMLGPSEAELLAQLQVAMRQQLRRGNAVLDAPRSASGVLGAGEYAQLIDAATRLTVVPAADAETGIIHEVASIAEATRSRSRAWVLVKVSAMLGVRPVTFEALGADVVLLSARGLGGGELAALAFRDRAMLTRINAEAFGQQVSPALAAGAAAAVDHLAGLADISGAARGTRRTRISQSVDAAASYLGGLSTYLMETLRPKVEFLGFGSEAAREADRIPVVSFRLPGVPVETVYQRLVGHALLPSRSAEGITVGLGVYNTPSDVDQLARVLGSLA
ncbi:aminotransferase class V-fold PLP-dependent enzyme [Corynebacterium sp. 153RC1]|uniref:aminotransferase class V-fold PLP-dependent enzyme n=1 Tax=unclassified Corynebacterium TaxID=2624378 RepID=UPI00211C642B|nr:aminotransferase class V-fold PLP-dependent enzyme [Corynebacterium sp. 209RC1]MCQ9355244.1 aminotransferase class V-fold PLP-dependent enzyme [Corynebacterium sp. 1222RC1]MCQ9357431.1 aminotransferase class V-fold PLP-dependent enzyme [Corynebacterium sp. 122RC1]MCQ9361655.1 aminotransferase class V-fold PLP-dependent enzyme [Corynebacterium sp. 153RC1]MCQ9363298.1 aminotransferase class V-fold PLP-dependent enzyme [Corynebacterium sp. 732RC1]MCQ9365874.1 aminotransferase class V-fold PLP-